MKQKATLNILYLIYKITELLKMVVAPSRHVFDEAICVHFMYSCIWFKNVLGIG